MSARVVEHRKGFVMNRAEWLVAMVFAARIAWDLQRTCNRTPPRGKRSLAA